MIQPRTEAERLVLLRELIDERFGPIPNHQPVPSIQVLRAFRREVHWSAYEVSRRLRVPWALVLAWENGELEIPVRWARKYAALFDEGRG